MSDNLNLTLPDRKKDPDGNFSMLNFFFLFTLIVIGLVNLFLLFNGGINKKGHSGSSILNSEETKELALKLKKRGLKKRSAIIWKEYLGKSNIGLKDSAKIWYLIGKLYQDSGSFEDALEAYYRSESIFPVKELESEINLHVQETLESMGNFSALRYELSDRVDMKTSNNSNKSEILAEIGLRKITKADIDLFIEEQIERQLAQFKKFLPEDQLKKQKESLFKRFSKPEERLRLLNQLVIEDVLYRKAMDDKLTEDPIVKKLIHSAKKGILAQKTMEKELTGKINLTDSDLKTYYEAKKDSYIEPEKAKISHILVENIELAKLILKKNKEGVEFEKLSKEHSIDKDRANNGGVIESWVTVDGNISELGNSKKANRLIFESEIGETIDEIIKSEMGFHIIKVLKKQTKRQKSFDEIRSEIYQTLLSKKEQEVSTQLFNNLKEKYNVVIHTSGFKKENSNLSGSK